MDISRGLIQSAERSLKARSFSQFYLRLRADPNMKSAPSPQNRREGIDVPEIRVVQPSSKRKIAPAIDGRV
jgi:hypothetical protein